MSTAESIISHIYSKHDDFWTDYFYTSLFEIGLPGLFVYLFASTGLFLYFYVIKEHKYFPKNADANWMKALHMQGGSLRSHILTELKASLINVTLSIPLNGLVHTLVKRGHSKVYYNIGEYGYFHLIFSSFCFVCWSEFWVYWAHYFLHKPWLYFLHKLHHSFIVTTPFCAWSFHPLDSALQALPHYIFPFLMPVYFGFYMLDLTYLGIWAAMIHDQVSFIFLGGLTLGSTHHEIHHLYDDYNFGQWTTVMDRLMGTYRAPLANEKAKIESIRQQAEFLAKQHAEKEKQN